MRQPEVIISLTSYPARIYSVNKVIKSLMRQIEKADKIILWLSEQDFPKCNEELPDELLQLDGEEGFCIRWVKENLKSHKKYFYVLQEHPDDIVITVDDDMYYAKTMVSTLLASYVRHPYAISARNVHKIFRKDEEIASYMTWAGSAAEYIDEERMDLCAIGVNGILYPPGCTNKRWFDCEIIRSCAENQDDLWLKYNEILDNIPVVYTGMEDNDIVIQETQESVLYIKNAYEGGNDNCIKKLVKQVVQNDADIFRNWINQLMPIDDYLFRKKAFYRMVFQRIFDDYVGCNIYICGAGKFASVLLEAIEKIFGDTENVRALLVSRLGGIGFLGNVRIQEISELDEKEDFVVICGVSEKYKEEFKDIFAEYKLCEWIELDMQGILDYIRITRAVSGNNE